MFNNITYFSISFKYTKLNIKKIFSYILMTAILYFTNK